MPPLFSSPWIFKAGLLPVLILCVCGGKSLAACGNEVHWGLTASQKADNQKPVAPHQPCSGPACQKAPAAPTTFPPVPFSAKAPRFDALLIDGLDEEMASARLAAERERPVLSPGVPLSIFHPPR